jgi:prepilin-type N-terminal cleavage/methylation domain-containing protein
VREEPPREQSSASNPPPEENRVYTTMSRRLRAFTLVELIVVIVIMGVLVAVGAFAYNAVMDSARSNADKTHTEQVSKEIKGAVAVRNLDLGQVIATTPPSADADTISNDLKTKLGVADDLYLHPLGQAGATPARLQVRDGKSYSCVPAGPGKATSGPCPLLINAGFESPLLIQQADGSDYVHGYFKSDVSRDTAESHTGQASARVTLGSATEASGVVIFPQRGLSLAPGTRVTAGIWVKAPEGVALRVGGRVLDSAYSYMGEQQGAKDFRGTGKWEYVETEPWHSADAVRQYAGIQVTTHEFIAGKVMWVDDVTLNLS